ncbi:MAG: hypothetical protein NT041_01110, partial [Candidatus Vogelbacteria bacterium]|nr:hypothetical protein [Candidatus Vogelbacteria bacterium]
IKRYSDRFHIMEALVATITNVVKSNGNNWVGNTSGEFTITGTNLSTSRVPVLKICKETEKSVNACSGMIFPILSYTCASGTSCTVKTTAIGANLAVNQPLYFTGNASTLKVCPWADYCYGYNFTYAPATNGTSPTLAINGVGFDSTTVPSVVTGSLVNIVWNLPASNTILSLEGSWLNGTASSPATTVTKRTTNIGPIGSATVKPLTAGTYSYTLLYKNAVGGNGTKTKSVIVIGPTPTAQVKKLNQLASAIEVLKQLIGSFGR